MSGHDKEAGEQRSGGQILIFRGGNLPPPHYHTWGEADAFLYKWLPSRGVALRRFTWTRCWRDKKSRLYATTLGGLKHDELIRQTSIRYLLMPVFSWNALKWPMTCSLFYSSRGDIELPLTSNFLVIQCVSPRTCYIFVFPYQFNRRRRKKERKNSPKRTDMVQ